MKKPKVSILIVNWNCGDTILNCIASIEEKLKKYTYEIVIVDNDSKDGSAKKIEKKHPNVKCFIQTNNR